MKQALLSIYILLSIFYIRSEANAQTVLSTTSTYLNNNGSGTVTFNLENTNPDGIIITDIAGVTGTSGNVNVEFYYNPTPVNGAPGNIDAANGWILVESNTITGVANTTTTTTQPFISGMSFLIPANTTYGIAIFATGQRYFTLPTGPTIIAAGGLNMLAGTNISYAGGIPPAAPTFTPRGWIGDITFMSAIACSSTPSAGVANSAFSSVCPNQVFNLYLTGQTIQTGIDYQWESATSAVGPWMAIAGATSISENVSQTTDTYYRCIATCTLVSMSDTTNTLFITTLPNLAGGTYTIGATGDYPDFTSAVNAMNCGIAGPVIFNVASGIYNEQIEIGEIIGTSATNTVTFKGADPANTKLIFAQN
ncbi:MAG: hypothetical protein M3Q58_04035, partial [Bacteroidota bacterium]|nr:hypothetical protein [Bacteroidota bacterium]